MEQSSSQYLYLVKNLRAILFFAPEMEQQALLPLAKWLAARYRNRKVGFLDPLKSATDDSHRKLLQKNPFVPLSLPSPLMDFLAHLEVKDDPFWLQILLSTHFACPLVMPLLPEMSANEPRFSVWESPIALVAEDRERKFNIRLADYAMTDFLQLVQQDIVSREVARFTGNELAAFLEDRRKITVEDGEKRFWRLRQQTLDEISKGTLRVVYFDWMYLALQQESLRTAVLNWWNEHPEFIKQFGHIFNIAIGVKLAL